MSLTVEEANKIIKERCPRCKYGALKGNEVRCWHPYHPGWIGGYGCEGFAQCMDFEDRGKIGEIKEILVFREDN